MTTDVLPDGDDFNTANAADRGAILDSTPLKFGKFKGKTPEWISENAPKGDNYLCWAYETVAQFDVCSDAMYRDIGGRGTRAVLQLSPTQAAKKKYEEQLEREKRNANRTPFDGEGEDLSF